MEVRASLRWLPLVIALAIAIYLCFRILQPFLGVLLWAVVLAVVFIPVHRRIEHRIGRPTLAAVVSTLLTVITIVGPVTLITIAVVREARAVAATLSNDSDAWRRVTATMIEPLLRPLAGFVDIQTVLSPEFIRDKLEALSGSLAIGTVGVVGGLVAAVAQLFLVVFTLFYLLRDRESIRRAAYDLLPMEERQLTAVFARTREVIAASVSGVVLIAGIQGLLGFFIFWALGLPSAVLWGVVMFFLSMIPMAGAFLVWAPAAVYLLLIGEITRGLILIVWGVLVVGTIDNVLSPKIVGSRVGMHELVIFFAVLGGIQIFGVLGLILGPVVVAVTLALIGVLREATRPTAAPDLIAD